MNNITIPFSFLKEHNIILSAKEIDFAISRKLIDLQDVEKIVNTTLVKYPNDEYLLGIALNILMNEKYLNPYVQYLEIDYDGENRENGTIVSDDSLVNDRWKYIILLWLFIRRSNDSADYDQINSVYASFDYPFDMVSFINYMPAQKFSEKEGYESIVDNWQNYLDINKHLINL